jgi:membrane protein DedA with SNARE-associated domain
MDPDVLLQGSIGLVFVWLMLGSLGVPLPEDAALLTAGVLVHRGVVSPELAVIVCYAGVVGGDVTLFFLARRHGMRLPFVKRVLPPERRLRIERAYHRYGGRLVFFARYIGGFRAAVFAMAGMHGMKPRRFIAFDAASASISVPFVITVGYFGSMHIERVLAGVATVRNYIALAALLVVLGLLARRHLHKPSDHVD